ncbi:uncharacterized protein Dwil_GK25121 [Drosophila willistoni]|uniref:Uncharacterized protein n=1 Tax=Drosophila willistoni TaxID=7260 RepID=B4NC99_DROWI|nr:uncharacterized protein LOC6648693 [Drosophila willistoni]EDW82458.1 uncharacterized protein Dwil_GK25121 [Drosophila willistoni]
MAMNVERITSANGLAANGLSNISETDNISAMELQSNRRMLYFSDGCMEELSSSESENEMDVPDRSLDVQLNEREMALGPRLRYKASKVGNKFLAGLDYVGGGLASFLGITNSKYASELEYYKRSQHEHAGQQDEEELDNNWQTRNNNNQQNRNDAIVVCAPAPTSSSPSSALAPPTRQ